MRMVIVAAGAAMGVATAFAEMKSATIDGETFRIAVDDGRSVRAVRYNCFAYPARHVWAKATQLPVSGFSVEFK